MVMVLSRQLGTLKKWGQIMTSVNFSSLSRSSRNIPQFPSWITVQSDFPCRISFLPNSQLWWTHWSQWFPNSQFPVVFNTALVSVEGGKRAAEGPHLMILAPDPSFLPVRLTRERGHSLPHDGDSQLALHLQAQIHVVPMTRESVILLDIKIYTSC